MDLGSRHGSLRRFPVESQRTQKESLSKTTFLISASPTFNEGRLELDEISRFELFDDDLERWRLEPNDLLVVEGNGSEKGDWPMRNFGRARSKTAFIRTISYDVARLRTRAHNFTLKFLNSPAGMEVMKKTSDHNKRTLQPECWQDFARL